MSVNIPAPSLRPPRVSLLSSSELIKAPGGERWMGGLEFLPLSAKDASGIIEICPSTPTEKDQKNRVGGQRVIPFGVYATDDCSTFGSGDTPFADRARQKLLAVESYWIERQLWEASDVGNLSFVTSPSTVTLSGSFKSRHAFSRLDAAVAQDTTDGLGMIHVTPLVLDLLQTDNLVRREGNVWLSPLDNIVVPGRGYTGNGPNTDGGAAENPASATVSWMFGHPGMIQIVRGEIIILGDGTDGINRSTNDKTVIAERGVAVVVPALEIGVLYAASVDITGE